MTTEAPFLRTPYNYDRNKASDASGLDCKDKTRTKQSFKDEVDINTIVERFGATGEIPVLDRRPIEGDFGTGYDFMHAQNLIRAAQESFDQLPAKTRARFDNDPVKFVEFVHDPENKDELRKWGLAKEPDPITPEPDITMRELRDSLVGREAPDQAKDTPPGGKTPQKKGGTT